MTNSSSFESESLAAECRSFTRYLCGRPATDYVARKYQEGHASLPATTGGPARWFDALQLAIVRSGSWGVLLVDGYSRWFRPHGPVRYKLTLLLAILENCPPYHRELTPAHTGPTWLLSSRLVLWGFGYTIALAISTVLLAPMHLLALLSQRLGS